MHVCREIGQLSLIKTNNYGILGEGWQGKYDVTQGQANSTGMPPNQNVNKPEELTYLSTNIWLKKCTENTSSQWALSSIQDNYNNTYDDWTYNDFTYNYFTYNDNTYNT